MNELNLNEGDKIIFRNTISWAEGGVYTVNKATEKAVKIGEHWLPISQILDVHKTTAKVEVLDKEKERKWDAYPFTSREVDVLELTISNWIDTQINKKMPKVYGF